MSKETAAEPKQGETREDPEVPRASDNTPQPLPNASRYVGTPALGTSKAASAAGISSIGPPEHAGEQAYAQVCVELRRSILIRMADRVLSILLTPCVV